MNRNEILENLTNLKDLLTSLSATDPDNSKALESLPNGLKIAARECEKILEALTEE